MFILFNPVARIINYLGIAIIVLGFIIGYAVGDLGFGGFKWSFAFPIWAYTFTSGILFIGFAQVIESLWLILKRLNEFKDEFKERK